MRCHPAGIYPLSKLAAEIIIKGYAQHHKIRCYIVRIANVYGPSLKTGTVLETMVSQFRQNGTIALKDLTPVRDFIYIEDIIEALGRLMLLDEPGCRIFNLSTGEGTSIGELARLFCELKELSPKTVLTSSGSGRNVSRLVLDNRALTQCLGWHPAITLRAGLTKIFEIQDEIKNNVKT